MKEKAGCQFCPSLGHSWTTPEGLAICFDCLRAQRNTYKEQAERPAAPLVTASPGARQTLKDCCLLLDEVRARLLAELGDES